jgi:hypothetical protein
MHDFVVTGSNKARFTPLARCLRPFTALRVTMRERLQEVANVSTVSFCIVHARCTWDNLSPAP